MIKTCEFGFFISKTPIYINEKFHHQIRKDEHTANNEMLDVYDGFTKHNKCLYKISNPLLDHEKVAATKNYFSNLNQQNIWKTRLTEQCEKCCVSKNQSIK